PHCHSRARTSSLSLHDALPISLKEEVDIRAEAVQLVIDGKPVAVLSDQESVDQLLETYQQRYVGGLSRTPQADRSVRSGRSGQPDRKSTRLNSSHVKISYAVFC